MKYIIDGYNLIHKIEQLQHKRLRSQREGLIRILESARAHNSRLRDVTVVFDGKAHVVAPRMDSTIRVVFSKGKCADKKIKEIVASSSFARDIAVVSDDRQIRSFVGSRGAKKISVADFLKVLLGPTAGMHSCFKLGADQKRKINQELEEIWLSR